MQKTDKPVWAEIKDMLTGAAFPFMIQIIFSASLILFADMSGDIALRAVILAVGEALLIGAYTVFGRSNGAAAYKKLTVGRRSENSGYVAGGYAVWKGFVIGLVSLLPYMVFQLIECIVHTTFIEFVIKYAFGWAAYPFILISEAPSVGKLSAWLNFIWVIIPVCVHAAGYVWGAHTERKRQSAAGGKKVKK